MKNPFNRLASSPSAMGVAALVLLAVLFVAVNLFSMVTFRSAQIDLTQNRLFTLSKGTAHVLADLKEPVTLRFFYSEKLANDYPQIKTYADRARDMLEEIRDRSNGKIILQVIDPAPYSEQEDLAMSLGLKGAPTGDGDVIYFGLVGTNLVDGIEAIPYFSDARAPYLEYDVTRLIQNLARPKKPVLGIVTNLPMDTGSGGLLAAMKGLSQPFMVYEELRQRFAINFLEQDFSRVPSDVDVLMIAHPRDLNARTLYAIDQFVMRGGRVLAFVDPQSEVSFTPGADGKPVSGYSQSSDLGPLLKDWGVGYDTGSVVADRDLAMRVRSNADPRRPTSDYVLWLAVPGANMNRSDIVTADIGTINLGTPGYFTPLAGAKTRFTPLISSSTNAETLPVDAIRKGPRPDELLESFKPTGKSYVLAARISGPLSSAFPDGPPLPPASDSQKPKAQQQTLKQEPKDFIASSRSDANIILVADSDIFDDRFWVHIEGQGPDRTADPFADNARFIMSAIDNLMGSDDLISLRARAPGDRPFTVVDDLQRKADARFLAGQQRLQGQIAAAEKHIADLQTQSDAGGEDRDHEAAIKAETARVRTELLSSRHALREVQRSLRADIDRLGTRVRFVNVALVPLLLAAAALVLAFIHHRRRKARAAGGLK
ncbi:MAG: Gldg family protein [Parvibaculaceae bacterium]|nr:Gldg family protein [Parvibaculaceae bacterium]